MSLGGADAAFESESGFRALLEAAPDAMVIVNPAGEIVLVNAQTERMFGYSRHELLGQRVELLVPARFREAHAAHRHQYEAAAQPRPMGAGLDLSGVRKDGSEFPVEISLSPLQTEAGTLIASAIRDITDRRAAEQERARLLHERAAHAEASRIKDEFLATLSHELRTPLNAILGWTTVMRDAALTTEDIRKAIATIERNARAQAHLIEDLLDVSRIVTGNLRLHPQPIDVAQVVENAADVVRPAADAKSLALNVVAEARPILLVGDPDRLQQAIWNLLSNSVKFSDAPGRIEARVWRGGQAVHVDVRDTGRGIDPKFLPHVFDRFRQADSSYTRSGGGLGLGLAIVRSVVELHGGTVQATSGGLGHGTMFRITLPTGAAPIERRRDAAQREQPGSERLDGIRILAVDDRADERDLLHTVFTRRGADVALADSVDQALARIREWTPAVVVTDIAMPDQDGYVLLQRIRSLDAPLNGIPAIAVTAHARAEDRIRALDAGFHAYVPKPIDHNRLVAAVRSSVEAARLRPGGAG